MLHHRKNDVSNQYAWLFSVKKGKEFTARDEEREEY